MNPIIENLKNTRLAFGEAALCRLGQHSFCVKLGETLLAIDPYLSPDSRRQIPSLIAPEEFSGFDWILASHDHGDHLDRPALAQMAKASPQANLIVPQAVRASVTEFPQERLGGINAPGKIAVPGLSVFAIPAAHELLEQDACGNYLALGYVLCGNGFCLYHSGDCCLYPELPGWLKPFALDLMLLPINGRDAKRLNRNCIGNMNFAEAVDLAGTLKAPCAVPAHYDMFAMNSEDPELFTSYMAAKYPATQTLIMKPGEIHLFRAKQR